MPATVAIGDAPRTWDVALVVGVASVEACGLAGVGEGAGGVAGAGDHQLGYCREADFCGTVARGFAEYARFTLAEGGFSAGADVQKLPGRPCLCGKGSRHGGDGHAHDKYLQTHNRPNVALVATAGGVVANGTLYEADCTIYASWCEVGTPTGATGRKLHAAGLVMDWQGPDGRKNAYNT